MGVLVGVLGLVWGGSMVVNFAWPQPCCNPTPLATVVEKTQLLNFHIGFLVGLPVLWTVFSAILLIGVVYYSVVQARKPFTRVIPPEDA